MRQDVEARTRADEQSTLAELIVSEGAVREAALERIVTLATRILDVASAAVTVVGTDRVWFETTAGRADLATGPRELTFGAHVVDTDAILVVEDALADPRFADFPSVRAGRLRFYAGTPLRASNGLRIGAFCVFDAKPRRALGELERELLQDFADLASREIENQRARVLNGILQGIAQSVGAALLCTNERGTIIFQNPAAERLLGFGKDELIGQDVSVVIPPRFVGAHRTGMARVAGGGVSKLAGKPFESIARRKDGSEVPIDLSLSVWRDETGLKIGSTMRDITDRKQREERLSRLAHYDPLTGLARATRFTARIAEQLDTPGPATVLVIEIEGMPGVNDSFGHAIGDGLIQAIAIRLLAAVPHGAKLARLSGGTFAVLLLQRDPIKARECASDIEMALAEPFEINDHTMVIGAAIGAALAPDHATTADDLVAAADLALQRAKTDQGNRFRLYETAMQTQKAARRALRDELRQALAAGELELHYQPQMSLATGALVGAEALMRWRHPQRGLLLPGSFIPAMDDNAQALHVGWWCLDDACRQIARWRAEGRPRVRVSVNLFAAQLRYGGLRTVVRDLVETYAIVPGELELEVRETIANQDEEVVVAALRDLRDLGVGIALDDFGTGFASLAALRHMPVSTIKIDLSFVRGLDAEDDPRDRAIVEAIIDVGRRLGLDVVAEGIETPAQAAILARMGCPTGQGFLFGRATQASELFARAPGPPSVAPGKILSRRR